MTHAHASENGTNEEITVVKTATKTWHVLTGVGEIFPKNTTVSTLSLEGNIMVKCHLMSNLDTC